MYLEVIAVLRYNKHDDVIHACVSKACFINVNVLYYRHVCILVFLHVFSYSMLLRCILKSSALRVGVKTLQNTIQSSDLNKISNRTVYHTSYKMHEN